MKNNFYCIVFLFSFFTTASPAQIFQWALGCGATNYNNISTAVKYDKQGNAVITGHFGGTVDFDPGPAVHNEAASTRAMFIAKYDIYGNYIWSLHVDINGNTFWGFHLDLDSADNILITGSFSGSADFDPSTGQHFLNGIGFQDELIAKYDENGNYLWAFLIGAPGQGGSGESITSGGTGNAFCAGAFSGTEDFDPGAGVHNEVSLSNSSSMFLAKYDVAGNYVWSVSVSSTGGSVGAESCAVDPNGDIIVTGYINCTADFDPGPGVSNVTYNGLDKTFVARYDANGNFISVFSIEINEYIMGIRSTVDQNGNIFLGGTFIGSADMDPGPGVSTISSVGLSSMLVAKYGPTGNFLWAHSCGVANQYTVGFALSTDPLGDILLTGNFSDTVDFDPGPSQTLLISDSARDAYVVRYDPNGNFTGGFNIPTSVGFGISVDFNGFIYLTGNFFSNHSDFDPQTGTYIINAIGQQDIYLARYSSVPLLTKDAAVKNEPTVFPNPVSDYLTFENLPANESLTVSLYSMQGELILSDCELKGNELFLGNYRNGNYVYRVLDKNKLVVGSGIINVLH